MGVIISDPGVGIYAVWLCYGESDAIYKGTQAKWADSSVFSPILRLMPTASRTIYTLVLQCALAGRLVAIAGCTCICQT